MSAHVPDAASGRGDLCFVIQPFDSGEFDRRYRELIRPTIEACGLRAYRVDEDYAVDVPVSAIEEKIAEAALIVAEITTDSPNVWFEVGYAYAKGRQVILLCSEERTGRIPFDVRHRNFLRYRPGDPEAFRERLTAFIRARWGGPEELTVEELAVLRFLSRDQKTPYAMTAEAKILADPFHAETVEDDLHALVRKGYLDILWSTTEHMHYYHLKDKAETLLYGK